VHHSSLSEVAAMMSREHVTAPAVVVIGDVAALGRAAARAPSAGRVHDDVGRVAARHQPGAAPQGAHGRPAGALR